MDAAIPADAQNAPTGIWKSRTEREIPTAPTPIIVVVNERKNNGDSNSVAKPSTESDQAQRAPFGPKRLLSRGAGRACAMARPPAVVRLECRLPPAENTRIRLSNTSVEVPPPLGVSWGHPRGLPHATTSRHGHRGGFPRALIGSAALMRSRPTSAWTGPKPSTRLSCTGSSRKSARLPSETVCSGCGRGQRPTCAPREDTGGQPFSVFQLTTMSGSSPSCLRSRGCHTGC